MSPQRFAVLTVLCGTLVLSGWVVVELAGSGSPAIENSRAPIETDTPQPTAMTNDSIAAVSLADATIQDAALPEPLPMPPPVSVASASTLDPVQDNSDAVTSPVEVAGTDS